MNCRPVSTSSRGLALGCLSVALVGCASGGPSRMARTVVAIEDTRTGLTKVRAQADQTLTSLSTLLNASPERLPSCFNKYSKDVDILRVDAVQARKRSQHMKTRQDEYLAAWEKEQSQVRDPGLRRLGDTRRSELTALMNKAAESLTTASETFDPFLSDLSDVQKVFDSDANPAGRLGVTNTGVIQGVRDKGAHVAQAIDAALEALSSVNHQFSDGTR